MARALFHTLGDPERARYVTSLAAALRPGGSVFLLCWSDRNPFGRGPRRISRREIRAAFRDGWVVEAIDPEWLDSRLPEGRVHAWLARIARVEADASGSPQDAREKNVIEGNHGVSPWCCRQTLGFDSRAGLVD